MADIKTPKSSPKFKYGNGIIGVMLVLVVASIAFSSYVVWFGTTGYIPKVMLTPQIAFAAGLVIWKFIK